MNSDTSEQSEASNDVRPVVATGTHGNLGLWIFVVVLVAIGAYIFSAMTTHREAINAPNTFVTPTSDSAARIVSPPPLAILTSSEDRQFAPARIAQRPVMARRVPVQPPAIATPPPPAPARSAREPDLTVSPTYTPDVPEPVSSPTVVYGQRSPTDLRPERADEDQSLATKQRVVAARLANPSFTVPQGTVIPAVLETALDSTRPGAARALVQRHVVSFDGSRILIPRGSRLYGEYEANVEAGQNRALVTWSRLLRPDGVTIALNSPSSDPLGRAGVKGKVDSKFFERFGGAILQSVLDIGVGVATREATDGVIVALPGSTQNVTPRISPGNIRPTLKVRHGTSVSVFVARDLDFSSVDS